MRSEGSIGFVPTMGALHEGHLSLVHQSVENDSNTVVSIFVNPTQFNNPNDLASYPRLLDQDLDKLKPAGCDLVFIPEVSEMYPVPDKRMFNFDGLEQVMEGKFRPGHFNGVAQIVTKLFDLVQPDRAYFGEKDFQQLAIIRKVCADIKSPVTIIGCPTVREEDGLAMSSRNLLLEKRKRLAAPLIFQTLKKVAHLAHQMTPGQIRQFVSETFEASDELELEYFDIVHSLNLTPVTTFDNLSQFTACIAVYAGKVRLIDNVTFNL